MKTNTIILTVATLVVALGAYWYFFTGTGNEPPLTAVSTENQALIRFQTLVRELQFVSFNTSIFSDARLMALVDLATPVAPETAGRLDPFAPVPGVSGR